MFNVHFAIMLAEKMVAETPRYRTKAAREDFARVREWIDTAKEWNESLTVFGNDGFARDAQLMFCIRHAQWWKEQADRTERMLNAIRPKARA